MIASHTTRPSTAATRAQPNSRGRSASASTIATQAGRTTRRASGRAMVPVAVSPAMRATKRVRPAMRTTRAESADGNGDGPSSAAAVWWAAVSRGAPGPGAAGSGSPGSASPAGGAPRRAARSRSPPWPGAPRHARDAPRHRRRARRPGCRRGCRASGRAPRRAPRRCPPSGCARRGRPPRPPRWLPTATPGPCPPAAAGGVGEVEAAEGLAVGGLGARG